jgi:hypothetical protein
VYIVDRLNESMQKIGQADYASSTPGADGRNAGRWLTHVGLLSILHQGGIQTPFYFASVAGFRRWRRTGFRRSLEEACP